MLGAFELLVGRSFPADLMPKAVRILKALYDADLLEEEVILQWGEKVNEHRSLLSSRYIVLSFHLKPLIFQ